MDKIIQKALENMGTMNEADMHNAFLNEDDARLMYDRYINDYEKNNTSFYNHLCQIDQWKFDKFIKTFIK